MCHGTRMNFMSHTLMSHLTHMNASSEASNRTLTHFLGNGTHPDILPMRFSSFIGYLSVGVFDHAIYQSLFNGALNRIHKMLEKSLLIFFLK